MCFANIYFQSGLPLNSLTSPIVIYIVSVFWRTNIFNFDKINYFFKKWSFWFCYLKLITIPKAEWIFPMFFESLIVLYLRPWSFYTNFCKCCEVCIEVYFCIGTSSWYSIICRRSSPFFIKLPWSKVAGQVWRQSRLVVAWGWE